MHLPAYGETIDAMVSPASKHKAPFHPRSIDAIADRLILTRQAAGLKPAQVCQLTGIKPNTYSMLEAGNGRPGLDTAIQLCDGLNVTLDWIYFGETGCLPLDLHIKIEALRRQ